MGYRFYRRIFKILTLLAVNLGAFGIYARFIVLPFLYTQNPFATFSDPVYVLEWFFIVGSIPFYALGVLIFMYAVFGRAFCGWMCPFGFLQDIVNKKKLMEIPKGVHDLAIYFKFFVLIFVLVISWFLGEPFFEKLSPSSAIFSTLPHILYTRTFVVNEWLISKLLILGFVLLVSILISRFWCRYFCPVGGLSGIFNKISLLNLTIGHECDRCGICESVCPKYIEVLETQNSVECNFCGECADECPKNAISISFRKKPAPSKEVFVSETPMGVPIYEVSRSIPDIDPSIEFPSLPVYGDEAKIERVLNPKLVTCLQSYKPKFMYFFRGEVPEFLKLVNAVQKIEFVNMDLSTNLTQYYGIDKPTLYINKRVYLGSLEDSALANYLEREDKMFEKIKIVFDVEKCKVCQSKKCQTICDSVIIDTNVKIDFTPVKELRCNLCGECIVKCPKGAISLSYGEPKLVEINVPHLLALKSKLEKVSPMELKIVVKRDSQYTAKTLTMVSAISYLSKGKINFDVVEPTQEFLKKHNISFTPCVLVGKFKTLGIPTEGSLVLLIRRSSRK